MPKLSDNKNITKRLRISQTEWQTIQTQMQEKNLNFSQLVLNSLLTQNSQTPTKSKKQKAIANKELVIELAKWGNNLNQIAKCLNTNKGAWDRLGLEQLVEISYQLEQLRSKYVG
ncbi:molybdopterin-guanine dinucleotide biosynthesis protein MobC [Helicobacter pylori]|uniref:plasmid mobilization protein n=1 Tax=Helicobacter pylori TaxID=210 RepID=UPI000991C89D|nr:plasmid mobilization relaxosome protein MobC [Helicobacter pylori]OOP97024.1 molybdopterin-guanine dinucleotide biosynthesis protein MobC [Helicobacter pylori]OOQ08233.1 molybdopterin-guanine dinucleotide biosynthesis protein MobC [Helicobacter pylori]OOQ08245.1 molybdopterin-guanine dinucleotide biosynthesis protein MobC [Helicobacter pylori]OOQ08811.1 molybdopterin-guanine dinucleotide biosynthesis protein MobC [Helicobacter pylori]PDW50013.1 molybdopterin-guanine dinucleotide biosynthesi